MNNCSPNINGEDKWADNDDVVVAIDKKASNNMTSLESAASSPSSEEGGNCCSRRWEYGGIPEAKGYALLAMGRGAAVMSNGTLLLFYTYCVIVVSFSVYYFHSFAIN